MTGHRARRWAGGTLGVLIAIGIATYVYAPFIGTVWRDDPVPLGNLQIGAAAPDFTAIGADGAKHKLSDYRGKTVVLEWTSPVCEFTAKHYDSGTMQKLQDQATKQGVIWLVVNSSGSPETGLMTAADTQKRIRNKGLHASNFLIDRDGRIGLTYGAVTTPSVYVIDGARNLKYRGAIDDNPWGSGTVDPVHSYLLQALNAISASKPVATATSRPYGCSIKYAPGTRAVG
jgi:AhpC/TSA family